MSSAHPSPWEGDDRQERFLALFLPEQGTVRAFIRSMVWDRAQCEDLFQEVALVLWRELDRYDATRPFGAWARGVAGKTVLKSLRRTRRAPLALSPEAIQALEIAFSQIAFQASELPPSREQDALRHCVETLPEKSQVLVRLRYRDSLKVTDIAARVTSSPDAVQKALGRLRENLQKCVERRLRVA